MFSRERTHRTQRKSPPTEGWPEAGVGSSNVWKKSGPIFQTLENLYCAALAAPPIRVLKTSRACPARLAEVYEGGSCVERPQAV
jgi:hypothetical protein